MNSLLIRFNPDCGDESYAARDIVTSLKQGGRVAFAAEFSGVAAGDRHLRWPEFGLQGDPVTEAVGSFVDDSAICLHVERAADIEIDQRRSNHAVVVNSGDASDPMGVFKLGLMDVIWCTSPAVRSKLIGSGVKSRILVTGLPLPISYPENFVLGEEPPDMLCVESDANRTGICGLVKAWIRSDLTEGKMLTIARTMAPFGDEACGNLKERLHLIRRDEGNHGHKVRLLEYPSPSLLDFLLDRSGAVASVHLGFPTWRPLVMKAAMLGLPILCSANGYLQERVKDAEVFETDFGLREFSYQHQIDNEESMAEALAEPLRRVLAGESKAASPVGMPQDASLLANHNVTGAR